MSRILFTLSSASSLPQVKVLLDSAKKFLPEWETAVVLLENAARSDALKKDSVLGHSVLGAAELAVPNLTELAFQYDEKELPGALKPYAFLHLFSIGYSEAIYVDPASEFFSSPEKWLGTDRSQATLVSQVSRPLEHDGLFPTNRDVLRAGQFHSGFLHLRNSDQVIQFLRFWAKELETSATTDADERWKGEQFFLAMIVSLVDRVCVVRDPGIFITEWNSHQSDGSTPVLANFTDLPRARPARGQPVWSVGFIPSGTVIRELDPDSPYSRLNSEHHSSVQKARALFSLGGSYSFGAYESGEAILSDDRSNYLNMSGLERPRIGNPFKSRMEIRKSHYALVGRKSAAAMAQEIIEIRRSPTWKAGRAVTWPLRKAKWFFQIYVRWHFPGIFSRVKVLSEDWLGGKLK